VRRARSSEPDSFSLVSFQDIVTALTGMMIVIVLLLVLDVAVEVGEPQKLIDQTGSVGHRLAEQAVSLEMRLANVGELPAIPLWDLERRTKNEEVALDSLRTQRAALIEERDRLSRDLSPLETVVAQASAQRAHLRDRARQISKELESAKKGNTLYLIPEDSADKRPIVIEASRKGFKALVLNHTGGIQEFADQESVSIQSSLARLEAWLEQRSRETEAVVVLVRPDSVGYIRDLFEMLRKNRWNFGYEPIQADREIKLLGGGK